MEYKTEIGYSIEELPWPPYIPKNATKLLLGTFPPQQNKRRIDFYYPNPGNRLWPVLANLAHCNLRHFSGTEAVFERKQILDRLNLGISSMGQKIIRFGQNSLDENIRPLQLFDVLRLLDQYPLIDTILLTSSTGKGSTLGMFSSYCMLNGIVVPPKISKIPAQFPILHAQKEIDVRVVNSTSAISAKSVAFLTQQYGEAIGLL